MTHEAALRFLREHQPMPDDDVLSNEVAGTYAEVLKYFQLNPDPECVPLFINAFGKGDGFGTYQLVEDVISMYPDDVVLPHLEKALREGTQEIQFWTGQIATRFSSNRLLEPLAALANSADDDLRWAGIVGMSAINDKRILPLMKSLLLNEFSPMIREILSNEVKRREMKEG